MSSDSNPSANNHDLDSGKSEPCAERRDQESAPSNSRSGIESKRETRKGFSFTTLEDLLAEPEEETPFVVEGLLPMGGSSILAGEPKAGKSTLVRTLVLSVAIGKDFCGRSVYRGPVLYLALEDKRAEIRRQFSSMRRCWAGETAPIHVHVGPAPQKAAEGLRLLENAIAEFKPVYVVIDVLHRFMRIEDTNDYGKVSTAMEGLNDLARRMGCHIMAVHHVGKGRDREGIEKMLGSTAFAGAVDTAVFYCRKGPDRVIEVQHLRYGRELPKTIMRLDRESGLVLPDGLVAERNDESLKDQILGVLGKQATMTQDEVRSALGGDTADTSRVLKRLVTTANVVRSGRGVKGDPHKYSLPVSPIEDKQESTESDPTKGPTAMESPVDPSLN